MFEAKGAFNSFSVNNLGEAKTFYSEVLSLKVDEDEMGLKLSLPGGAEVFVYAKDNHQPATFTVLNLVVDSVDEAVTALKQKGVAFESYDQGMIKTDVNNIARGLAANMGPDIAWFKDPAGNVLSVLQEE